MLEILSSNTKDNFFKLIKEANKEIYLCAPFIKENIVSQILLNKKDNVKLTVITSNNISYFLNKSVDISAIKTLINNNVKVFNYNSLHTLMECSCDHFILLFFCQLNKVYGIS